jgi:hypothetical protein
LRWCRAEKERRREEASAEGWGCLRNRGGSAAAALWLISSGGKLSGFLQRLSTLAEVEE